MYKKKIQKLYPVILFVYKRPSHTKKVIFNLKKNYLAKNTILYVFSDGPKNISEKKNVEKVRKIICNISGFKKVIIYKKNKNIGLKKSILTAVNKIIKKHKALIVLEDDILTAPYFLKYMNEALNFYKDKKKVWHISGWNVPLENKYYSKTFFYRSMNCWGWATWVDRWCQYENDIRKIESLMDSEKKFHFNNNNTENFYWQLIANKKKYTSTWAIFWYLTIFLNNGLCVNPYLSLTKNIGLDNSGSHGKKSFQIERKLPLNKVSKFIFSNKIVENKKIYSQIVKYYKFKNFIFFKAINKILNFF
jgi:hypothetical protein